MAKTYYFSILIVFGLFVISCSKDEAENDDIVQNDTDECSSEIGYSEISPLISNNCGGASCHGSGSSQINLVTYQDLKTIIDDGRMESRVLGTNANMPPSGWDSSDNKELLRCWVENGAPE